MKRLDWIDTAKALGIFLVFYGHLIENVSRQAGLDIAFLQYKFIYAFHMPFFFFISGFFGKKERSLKSAIHKLLVRRLTPVLTFSLMTIPFWIIFLAQVEDNYLQHVFWKGLNYLRGVPSLNIVTWFLICLMVTEIMALIIFDRIQSWRVISAIALVSLVFGLLMSKNIETSAHIFGIEPNTWYFHESFVALGFYLAGYLLYPVVKGFQSQPNATLGLMSMGALLLLLFTFDLNRPTQYFAVSMGVSSHGEIIPFIVSAFAGTFFLIGVSLLLPTFKPLLFIGRNTLVLLGLNGIFHHFFNQYFVRFYFPGNSWLLITLYCFSVSVVSILISIPLVTLFNKHYPQLIGKTKSRLNPTPQFKSLVQKEGRLL